MRLRCRNAAGETPSSSSAAAAASCTPAEERSTALDQLLAEMCRYCDRDCGPGESSAQLKAKLKRAILAKYSKSE